MIDKNDITDVTEIEEIDPQDGIKEEDIQHEPGFEILESETVDEDDREYFHQEDSSSYQRQNVWEDAPETYVHVQKPMMFHMFWTYFCMPLSIISSIRTIISGISGFAVFGMLSLIDILLPLVTIAFIIPAFWGLLHNTRKGYLANRIFIIFNIISQLASFVLMLVAFGWTVTTAYLIPSIILQIVISVCIWTYYQKREEYFRN